MGINTYRKEQVAPLYKIRLAEFIAAVRLRLGAPVYVSTGLRLSELSDMLGDHALCCRSQGERISRHNRLRDASTTSAARCPAVEGQRCPHPQLPSTSGSLVLYFSISYVANSHLR
jgi:hypothetical protein